MKNLKAFIILLLLPVLFVEIIPQQLVINEVMSSNGITIKDEDGEYSDWIEIYNGQQNTIDLNGYGLSDDSSSPFKWIIPSVILNPNDHLLIFASDKNRRDYVRHWETIIDWGDTWKYRLGTSEPPLNWKYLGFDDQLWTSGPSGFGFGDNDDSTIVPSSVNSVYIRKKFSVNNASDVLMAVLHVDYDDAFVAYLNGIEIARENIGTVGIPPAYNQSAATFTEPLIIYGGRPRTYIIQNLHSLLQNGENVIALQVHNYGTGSSDLTLIPFLSLGMNAVPQNPNGINPLLDVPNKYLHTNFKLSSDGESLIITNPQSSTIDVVNFGSIGTDISYGRKPDGSNNWALFSQATPGDSNTTQGYSGVTGNPIVSVSGGFYSGPVTINVTPASLNDTIRYTLDGSEPTDTSSLYTSPIQISTTKVLRVKSFSPGFLPGRTISNTYFINFSTTLPVFSISTAPRNLFDEEYGIYTMGDSAEPNFPYFGANFWKDWEKPIHIELFEPNNSGGFSIDAGVKIFGGWTRGLAQKSLAIFARGQYGYNIIDYKLFEELSFTQYQSFVLRNSGNDWGSTMFRDALMTNIVDGIDIDKQHYRPALLFINGEYWGIQNLREKVNEHFIAQHHNLNSDSVDILQYNGEVVFGDSLEYMALYSFIENNDLALQANYDYVKSKIDIDNYIRYFVSEIYFDNQDWPGSNIKFWKKRGSGKWRWILFDTDFGYGLWNSYAYQNNTLQFALEPNGPNWPNPPWSTLFLRKLVQNVEFKNNFINCFADLSNTVFRSTEVINKINLMASIIQPEITRHAARWNQFNYNTWLNNVQVLRNFASQRINFLRSYFSQQFGLSGLSQVNLSVSDTIKGSLILNSIKITSPTWSGIYFNGIPIIVKAVPKRGYKFVKWSGSNNSTEDSLRIILGSAIYLNAIYEIDSNYSTPKIVFNEINYNSSLSFNTEDWVELFNNGESDVDISGWIFKDADDSHIFTFQQGTILEKDSFLVFCIDTSLFKSFFPNVKNFIGNTGFGLSGNSELIRLYDNQLNLMDSLVYADVFPWPTSPDGNGPTLSLRNPDQDNTLGENWMASIIIGGTPGRINDIFVNVDDIKNIIPDKFLLCQNYPNPFNPGTKINWQTPIGVHQVLKIYDILGKEVATLVDEYREAGSYEITFDASKLSSGIYFYKLYAGNFVESKKMILIK